MIEGCCHCGAVRWRFDGPLESVTACNCTVCRRYGVLWAYGYVGEEITVSGPTVAYERGREPHLGFHFCGKCGCVAFWRGKAPGADGRVRIAVNTRLAEDAAQVAPLAIDHFDGLDTFDDLGQDGRTVKDMWF